MIPQNVLRVLRIALCRVQTRASAADEPDALRQALQCIFFQDTRMTK